MIALKGRSVYGGIARGTISFYQRDRLNIPRIKINDPAKEWDRYTEAKNAAVNELKLLRERTAEEIGQTDADIFYIQQMLLGDSQFERGVSGLIYTEKCNAEYAVAKTSQKLAEVMRQGDSDYIRERCTDVFDASERVIRLLQNQSSSDFVLDDVSIICAEDLLPSETATLDKSKVAAFCTSGGSTNSHTAILARTMNIPALIGLGDVRLEDYDGRYAIVDGYDGVIYIEPDTETTIKMARREEEEGRKRELLQRLKGRRNLTRDGREIEVYANIGGIGDLESVIENDAGGIGLLRSEFLYLQRDSFPDEEELFYNYRRVVEEMKGKRVVIRTLDIGADKTADYFELDKEENPALGMRAVRLCLRRQDIFRTQLRALLRASAYGKLSILIPMIIDVDEVYRVKDIIHKVKDELISRKISFDDRVELGVMIETPAAVMISDLLAKEVDFFSIGTNDLEQYTLAIDRQNPNYENVVPPNHLAVLRMIKMVVDNAHSHGKKVCLCGEMGADLSLTEVLMDMKLDALSVAPPQVLPIRRMVRSLNLSDRRQVHDNIQRVLHY
ncbi:phosphoenolpyruvate--protein phosphotransferase [Ruminococcus albus]|uniref:Phosphoenolpyruvate-protein phosphotransferase n=1 Tax=Ruminococcus albus 8 TaxID=246199 RepID=E9S998_RUMAL|nr:phosphoenolpyruvate--protein phosphotransferase [Ruminococcus albus]EGC04055.1 phosphoenolpyruvate-protein phosphotransferase [Ruminococcus albus 8]MCC3350743.1 phosphoenolpyruvate--protein phosphotransferase [Ruminococcus albus 8]